MNRDGMCILICGALGSGKTRECTERIVKHLALGGTVVTNVALLLEGPAGVIAKMANKFGVIFDPTRLRRINAESIRDFHDFAVRGTARMPAMLALDEAALDLNARDWRDREEEAFHMVVLCRKLGIILLFLAQDAEDMDSQIRRKFNQVIVCRSLSNLYERDDGTQVGLPIFATIRSSNKLGKAKGQGNVRLGWRIQWGSFAFGCFDSHALHGARAKLFEALEQATDKPLQRVPVNWMPRAAVACGLALASLDL